MSNDPNLYELIIQPTDSRESPQIIRVTGSNPEELIEAARQMSEVKPGPFVKMPREVMAVVNGLPIARFAGRWLWDTHNQDFSR